MIAVPQTRYIVNERGKKTAVLLSMKQYERLLEDLHDLAVVAERRNEEPVSLEDVKKQLIQDGLL